MVIVSHGDVIRAALLFALGMPLDFYSRIEVALASISTIRLDASSIRVLALNEGRGCHRHRNFPEAGEAASAAVIPLIQAPCAVEKKFGEQASPAKQTVVDRGSEPCPVIGMAGTGVGIGTARPRVAQPGGGGERCQLRCGHRCRKRRASSPAAKEEHRRLPFRFERRRKATAEKAIDRGAIERPHLVAHGLPRGGRADEIGTVLEPREVLLPGR